mmetsp:Transcript_22059/g.63104  ORF Transcript_22059/g.63104 Transcript_22059/m.63104 type:complete len:585 (-) Transcript_22059:75-1829(-)
MARVALDDQRGGPSEVIDGDDPSISAAPPWIAVSITEASSGAPVPVRADLLMGLPYPEEDDMLSASRQLVSTVVMPNAAGGGGLETESHASHDGDPTMSERLSPHREDNAETDTIRASGPGSTAEVAPTQASTELEPVLVDDSDPVPCESLFPTQPMPSRRSLGVDDDGAALCLICLHPFLSQDAQQDVCALVCGHVYHCACFQQWLMKGKGDCCQCKVISRSDQLRMLRFDLAEMAYESYEEVLRLERASDVELGRIDSELRTEYAASEEALCRARVELAECQARAQDKKRLRSELAPKMAEFDKQLAEVRERLLRARRENAALQDEMDMQATRQHRRLHLPAMQDNDTDLLDERRRLRVTRPAERAQQLHEGLVMVRRQEHEARILAGDRRAAADGVEEELRRKRQLDSRLQRQLSERLEEERQLGESVFNRVTSAKGSQDPKGSAQDLLPEASGVGSTPQGARAAEDRPFLGLQPSGSSASVSAQLGPGDALGSVGAKGASDPRVGTKAQAAGGRFLAASPPEDLDFLYGVAPRRPSTTGHILARAARPALAPRQAPVRVVGGPHTPRRGVLQSLFSAPRV